MTSPPVPEAGPPPVKAIFADRGSVAAERIDHVELHQAPPSPVSWPVLVGQIPAAASAFQDRSALRERVDAARAGSGGVVLTQVLSGGGGVGKSQLAAGYARDALAGGADLVVWVDAAQPGAIADVFARAARAVRAPGVTGADAEADAREFLAWAAATSRSWLVVLDDITDPVQVAGWWPASPAGAGWVLATTRRRDAALTGSGRSVVDVGAYKPGEAGAYLARRLDGAGLAWLADEVTGALAAELGYLPLALSHAAAYMIDQQVTCSDYLDRYAAGLARLDELMPASADADGYGRSVAATLLLALDAADACDPVGLARPAMCLAGLLDPAGHPATVWTTEAVTSHLTSQLDAPGRHGRRKTKPVTPEQARAAVLLLNRYGLAVFDEQAGPRAVRVHAVTARAAREATPADRARLIELAAADALLETWPDPDQAAPTLAEVLRANAAVLARHAGDALWQPDGIPIIFHAGSSLLRAGLHEAAAAYWQRAAADSERLLGAEHPDTLTARANLAASYRQAGRTAEAIAILERVVADRERLLGAEHPDAVAAVDALREWKRETEKGRRPSSLLRRKRR